MTNLAPSPPLALVPSISCEPTGHCRHAVPEDRLHFVRLWRAMMTELYDAGSKVLPNERNLYLCRDYFDAYTTGRLDGVVVFWSPDPDSAPAAVTMAGAGYQDSMWELDRGGERWGSLWGVYVEPAHRGSGVGLQMELLGRERLRVKGFHCLVTTVHTNNPLGKANWKQLDELHQTNLIELVIVGRLDERQHESQSS